MFRLSTGDDNYPLYINIPREGSIPEGYDARTYQIFHACGLANAAGMLLKLSAETYLGRISKRIWSAAENLVNGKNYVGTSMEDLEKNNKSLQWM